MLPLPNFLLEAPDTLATAVQLAAEPGARLLSGGTDLLPSMKHRLYTPRLLVSTRRLAVLREVGAASGGGLRLGAGLRLAEVAAHAEVRARFPALAAAASTVATPTIQRMGTLGGNLMLDTRCMYYNQPAGWRAALGGCLKCEGSVCHVAPRGSGCYAAHSADTVPVLWAYDAVAEVATPAGTIRVPVADLYSNDGRTGPALPDGSVLVALELPPAAAPVGYRKLRQRGAIDYALLLTAVQERSDGWRAVLSAVGPRPVVIEAPTPDALAEAAYAAVQPLATHQQAVTWRKKLVRVEVQRAAAALG